MNNQLYVNVYIPAQAAVLNGSNRAGTVPVPLDGTILSLLPSAKEREVLAAYCALATSRSTAELRVVDATPTTIAAAIRAIVAQAAAETEKEAQKRARVETLLTGPVEDRIECDSKAAPGYRHSVSRALIDLVGYSSAEYTNVSAEKTRANLADIEAEDARLCDEPVAAHLVQKDSDKACAGRWDTRLDYSYTRAYKRAQAEVARRNELREVTLLRDFESVLFDAATSEQGERYRAGVLPVDERDALVRGVLFDRIDLPPFTRLNPTDLTHTEDCHDHDVVTFQTSTTGTLSHLTLTAEEYAAVKRVHAVFDKHPRLYSITYRTHTGNCDTCEEEIEAIGARVTLSAGEHKFSREYKVT